MLEPAGQSLDWLAADDAAPICRVLGALGERRRGIVLEVTRTGGGAAGAWVLSAPTLEAGYSCDGEVGAHSPAELAGCAAERDGEAVCLVGLEPALADIDARFASLPFDARGTLLLSVHLPDDSDSDAAVADLAEVLSTFTHSEQVFVASARPALLEAVRQGLRERLVYNVRTALFVEDLDGFLGEAGSDEAYAAQLDLVLVPARRYDDLLEDASRLALQRGGVAYGVYEADQPSEYARLVEHEGLALTIGALAPALAEAWDAGQPAPFDCRSFLETRQRLARYLSQSATSCPVF